MNFKYLVFSGLMVWGKYVIEKDYFIQATKRGDFIVNTEDWTYYDIDTNSWQPVKGDEK